MPAMHGQPDPLAPTAEHAAGPSQLPPGLQTGGVGLYDHAARDPFPRSIGAVLGGLAIVLSLVVGASLVLSNPAFHDGRAAGTPDKLGAPPAAVAGPDLAPGSPAAEGLMIVSQKPCGGCHVIPGVPSANGAVGPSLAGVGGRARIAGGAVEVHSVDDLKRWVQNPGAVKPGTAMPATGLSEDEATKVAAYLSTLK
jgi:cytochrome c